MTSSLNLPFISCNGISADRDPPVLLQVSYQGHLTSGHAKDDYSVDGRAPKTTLKTSCLAISEQDFLGVFLGESLPMNDRSALGRGYQVLDSLSSGLVGSLSAGSAGMIETQIALSNWESTHQTSRGRDHLFDYDQICDSSRGLPSPLPVTPTTPDPPRYESRHISPWVNLNKDLPWTNYSLEQIPQTHELENLIFPNPGAVAALPSTPQIFPQHVEIYELQDYNQPLGQPLGLQLNDPLEYSKICSDLNDQNETGVTVNFNQSPSDLNSWFGSFDNFLNSLASEDNSQFSSTESSLPSSSTSSPEAGLAVVTMEPRTIYPPRQRRQTHRAGSETCQHCGATFLRPSELKRHTSKHILPYKCPYHGCTCAFAQRKDLDRHLTTRKHWHKENQPLPRVFCHVEGCRFATEGFTRKDNLLRHMRRTHRTLVQENLVDMKV